MPQKKSAGSLKVICLAYILRNMDKFCTGTEISEQVDDADAIGVGENTTNPIHQLPSVLLDALTEIITQSIKPPDVTQAEKFLHQIITPRLTTLNLSSLKSDFHYIFALASVRCKHLKRLLVTNCSFRNSDFLDNIPNFSNLQFLTINRVLNTKFTLSGDDLFHFLGTHCKDLRNLYAMSNQVSDAGIHGLCVVGNCKLLRVLNVGNNPITSRGIRMALDNLPLLKFLYHESLLESLASIAQTALDQKIPDTPKQYSLSMLHLSQTGISKSGTLGQSLLLCPYITDLSIVLRFEGIKNVDLLSILSLKTLYSLRIVHNIRFSNRFDESVTFDGGILPLLKSIGESLKKLNIEGFFRDIDISAVIQLCPNLHYLELSRRFTVNQGRRRLPRVANVEQALVNTKIPILMHLRYLLLDGGSNEQNSLVSPDILLKLLSSPSLYFVKLLCCNTLTDAILQNANDLHSFRNLEHLTIHRCTSVTKQGIDVFMQENNPLKEIHFTHCRNITDEDVNYWKAMATEMNWKFRLSAGP